MVSKLFFALMFGHFLHPIPGSLEPPSPQAVEPPHYVGPWPVGPTRPGPHQEQLLQVGEAGDGVVAGQHGLPALPPRDPCGPVRVRAARGFRAAGASSPGRQGYF